VSGEPARPEPTGVVLVDRTGDIGLAVSTSIGSDVQERSIEVRLFWQPNDPLSVRIEVDARPDHPALPRGRWIVLRDFLRYGITVPTGDGDVRVTPDSGTGLVYLDLARPRRACRVALPVSLLDSFLAETERRVPLGAERSDDMVEAFIEKLLR